MPKHAIAGAAALLLTAAPAFADLEARALWSDLQETYARFGGALSAGAETYEGGTLLLEDVALDVQTAGARSRTDYGTVRIRENGDGTATIELPDTIEISVDVEMEGAADTQEVTITHDGLRIAVSEADGGRVYDTQADEMTISTFAEAPNGTARSDVEMTIAALAAVYRFGIGGDPDRFEQTLSADELVLRSTTRAEEDGAPVSLLYGMNGVTGRFEGEMGEAPAEPVTTMGELGMTLDGGIRHAGSSLLIDGAAPGGPFTLESTSAAGTIDMAIEEDAIGYELGSSDVAITAQFPGFPVPVGIAAAETALGTTLPFGEPGSEKPFGLSVITRDLVVDDVLWSLFDPTGQLPRDPATLEVVLSGTATPAVDLFGDPEAMATLQGPPADLNTLRIERLLLDMVGASLQGSGELRFPSADPSDPVGTIELALDGGFALIDRLVALGFVPPEQAAFAKGMAGAVARNVGDDQLETEIEFTEGGGISANGMPLR